MITSILIPNPPSLDTVDFSDLESVIQIISSAPTIAAARLLLQEHADILALHGLADAVEAALRLYDRLPFLSATAAHTDAEALHLWKVAGLNSRCV